MAFEDWTGDDWTTEDDDDEMTVAANLIEIDDINMNGSANVFKDGGVDHFTTTLNHKFEVTITQVEGGAGAALFTLWRLSNSDGGAGGFALTDPGLMIDGPGGSDYALLLSEWGIVYPENISDDLDYGVKYYIEIVRTASPDVTVYIRTGSHTGVLIDTLTIEDIGDDYRYLYSAAEFTFGM